MSAGTARPRGSERALLELCVDDVVDFDAALRLGADRIEVCARLDDDGLTPEAPLLAHALAARSGAAPRVVAMLRPRPGTFVVTADDREGIDRDLAMLVEAGAGDIVCGFLDAALSPHDAVHARIRTSAAQANLVFHRAFDVIPDGQRDAALERLVDCGFARLLTAGGPSSLSFEERRMRLAELVERAAGRISIVACGSLRPPMIEALRAVGIVEFHASARPRGNDARFTGRLDETLAAALRAATARP